MSSTQPPTRGSSQVRQWPLRGLPRIQPSENEGDYRQRRRVPRFVYSLGALLLALAASGLAVAVLQNAATQRGLVFKNTVIAAQTIPVGTQITPAMIQVKSVPTIYRPSDAAQSASQVLNTFTLSTIPKGVPVTLDTLTAQNIPDTISGLLPKGATGFFLPTTIFLTPLPLSLVHDGDHVDLYIAGYGLPQSSTPNPVIHCLSILRVLGTGQSVPQGVISASGTGTQGGPGLVLVAQPSTVSSILYLLANNYKLALTVDRYDAC